MRNGFAREHVLRRTEIKRMAQETDQPADTGDLSRDVLEHMSHGFALHEIVCDENGAPADYVFLGVNSMFEALTGLRREDVVGRRVRDVIPGIEDIWIQRYGRVALTGEPARFESFSTPLNRWYEVFTYRPAHKQFAVMFSDITEYRQARDRIEDIARFPQENPFPVLRIREDGNILFANQASKPLLEEWKAGAGGSVPGGWKKAIAAAAETRTQKVLEETIGDEIFAFHIVPVSNTDYVNVYGNEVTYLKKAQAELEQHKHDLERQVRERTRELHEAYEELSRKQESLSEAQRIGRMGNWEWNIAANELEWSDEIYRIFGLRPREFGATYDAFLASVHPDDRDFVTESVNNALDQSEPYSIHHRIVLPDGTERIVHEHAEIFRDDSGKAVRMMGTVQDVTERRQAEQAVLAERQRFNNVLEVLPVYVLLLSPDYHVAFANRFFRERFGESRGRRCFEYMFGRSEPCEVCESFTVLHTGTAHQWEWSSPDGGVFEVFDFPFTDADGSLLVLEMGVEITERRRAEQALRDREKQLEMLSRKIISLQEEERAVICRNLHDELGQRMTALGMEINWLEKQERVNPEDIANLGEVLEAINIELHRIYKGLRPAALDRLGLEAAIQSMLWDYRDQFALEIHAHIQEQACPDDNDRSITLYRILQELLTNITRHSGAKQVDVSLKRDNGLIVLDVEDNGAGFDAEKTTRRGGLGLLGIHERAAVFGGDIEVRTAPGQGTHVRVHMQAGDEGELK